MNFKQFKKVFDKKMEQVSPEEVVNFFRNRGHEFEDLTTFKEVTKKIMAEVELSLLITGNCNIEVVDNKVKISDGNSTKTFKF